MLPWLTELTIVGLGAVGQPAKALGGSSQCSSGAAGSPRCRTRQGAPRSQSVAASGCRVDAPLDQARVTDWAGIGGAVAQEVLDALAMRRRERRRCSPTGSRQRPRPRGIHGAPSTGTSPAHTGPPLPAYAAWPPACRARPPAGHPSVAAHTEGGGNGGDVAAPDRKLPDRLEAQGGNLIVLCAIISFSTMRLPLACAHQDPKVWRSS